MRRIFPISLVISIIALVHCDIGQQKDMSKTVEGVLAPELNETKIVPTFAEISLTKSIESVIGRLHKVSILAGHEITAKAGELKNASADIYDDVVNKVRAAVKWANDQRSVYGATWNETQGNLTDRLSAIMSAWKDEQTRKSRHEDLFENIMEALEHAQKAAIIAGNDTRRQEMESKVEGQPVNKSSEKVPAVM